MSSAVKPELRRLLHNQIKKNLIVAIGLSIVGGIAYKFAVNDVRKARYMNFYKNYDIDKEFERMRNKGVFDSCPPDA